MRCVFVRIKWVKLAEVLRGQVDLFAKESLDARVSNTHRKARACDMSVIEEQLVQGARPKACQAAAQT